MNWDLILNVIIAIAIYKFTINSLIDILKPIEKKLRKTLNELESEANNGSTNS